MSKKLVVHGAMLKCSQGTTPVALAVLPLKKIDADNQPGATVEDYKPTVNIKPFGMCNSTSNPAVISATAAAQGVHTPMPCVPVIASAWSPGSSIVTFHGEKALTEDSKCNCNWNGSIEITTPLGNPDLD
ncbi:MAG: DUF4280 domain-containing protein [Polyangiaceae bacterium]